MMVRGSPDMPLGLWLARLPPSRPIRPIHGGAQRRPDLGVDDQVGQVVVLGWLPVDDHRGGPALFRERRKPRRGIDHERRPELHGHRAIAVPTFWRYNAI